jgi:hypothetical protein
MGGLEPIDLPETPLIIGNNFPVQDETAYAREAESQRVAGRQAGGAGGAVLAAANYTAPQFRGNAGAALAERLFEQHGKHTDDEIRHTNVAGWLDLGSDNIARTKATMNKISSEYHDGYADLTGRAQAESWTQQQLRKGKDDLVGEAQERVRVARNQFDERHHAVVKGVTNGVDGGPFPLRPSEIFQFTGIDLYPHEPTAADIRQRDIGDCYFDATIGAIAHANPQWIKDRIHYHDQTGTFDVTLWNGHEWQHITVTQDDIQADIHYYGASWYDPDHPDAALWPSVLETAYAKLQFPGDTISYALGDHGIGGGGQSRDAMQALTGNSGVSIDPMWVWRNQQHLDQEISRALTNHQPVTISTSKDGGPLVGRHAYIVEGISGVGSDARLVLRNTWEDNPNDPGNPLTAVRLGDVIGSGPTGLFADLGTHPTDDVCIGELGR